MVKYTTNEEKKIGTGGGEQKERGRGASGRKAGKIWITEKTGKKKGLRRIFSESQFDSILQEV